jgi:AcrR family transcriptional regulator
MAPKSRRPYHHGNLRAELVCAGVELLRREGVSGLTLRGVARASGVSQAAPYRHFGDKGELLAAVAARGFTKLHERCQPALATADPRRRLRRLGQAYVLFALDEPAMFRLMFGAELVELKGLHEELAAAGTAVFDTLSRTVADIYRQTPAPSNEAGTACHAAWSVVHGLASLLIDGRIVVSASQRAKLIEDVTALFVRGLKPGSPAA